MHEVTHRIFEITGTGNYPWGQSYKPAVDDLWHPLSPAHGLPRILASEKILNYFSERDQGAPPSPLPYHKNESTQKNFCVLLV